jgi:hypothetical protein
MTRWALPALALLLASPANAQDLYAADQLAACVIGSAVVRIEKWNEPYEAAVEQAWQDCDALVELLPPDQPGQEMTQLEGVDEFVTLMLFQLTQDSAALAPGYTLTPPENVF